MEIQQLPSIVRRSHKRVGRGHGCGKVKTSGRGTKGQNARGHMPIGFEGGQLALIKRLPLLRGKDRNASQKPKAVPVYLGQISSLPKGTTVSLETLKKYHIIDRYVTRVKVIGVGSLNQAYSVSVPCSMGARQLIEKAGGSVS